VLEADAKLDDVMLAMDVVDTLRHERMLITRDINSEVRRETLVDRLREIYRGQGITVPDDILMDGVEALEEERFRYVAPREGVGTRLARVYINRGKWMPLIATVLAVIGMGAAINYVAFERPAQVEAQRFERLSEDLTQSLQSNYDAALGLAGSGEAKQAIEGVFAQGQAALATGNADAALSASETLQALQTTLALEYNLDIINRTGQMSGVIWDNVPYVIVQATGADGAPVALSIPSSVTGRTAEVSTFGIEVDRATFEAVGADFTADDRVDATEVGSKARGEIEADYVLDVGSRRIVDAAKWRVR